MVPPEKYGCQVKGHVQLSIVCNAFHYLVISCLQVSSWLCDKLYPAYLESTK